MARKARVEFEGAVYHVLDRGDRREAIFKDDADRRRFLETFGEACVRTGWGVQAYVLMSNHYDLMIETPRANLIAGMRWFAPPALSRKASAQTMWRVRSSNAPPTQRASVPGPIEGRLSASPAAAERGSALPVDRALPEKPLEEMPESGQRKHQDSDASNADHGEFGLVLCT